MSHAVLLRRLRAVRLPTTSVLRATPVLLNQFRSELPQEEARQHRKIESDSHEDGIESYGGPQRRRGLWGFLKVFLGCLGWILFFSVLSRMNYIYSFLDFLDVAFPRKLHALRLCFDLLPSDQKMHLVSEFRKHQRSGYGDSLFEYILEFHPEVMTATGLTPFETLRRVNFISNLVYEAGEDSDFMWRDLLANHAANQSMAQSDRLTSILTKAGSVLVDKNGMPMYAGQSIFGELYDSRKESIKTFPPSEAPLEKSANQLPRPGWRLL